jgi:hypothetical protein
MVEWEGEKGRLDRPGKKKQVLMVKILLKDFV